MSDSVDRVFTHALNTIKRIPKTGSARPPLPDRLKLYGLYKQSMEGNVEGIMDRPLDDGTDVQAEREKWDAWHAQHNLSRTEAKRRYISTLIETMHRYASPTPEAQELISELEFVWDQIKINTAPAATRRRAAREQERAMRASVSRRENRRRAAADGRDSRLRVLSPVSQPESELRRQDYTDDDEDEEGEDNDDDFQEARDSFYDDEVEDEDESEGEKDDNDAEDAYSDETESEEDPAPRRRRRRRGRGGGGGGGGGSGGSRIDRAKSTRRWRRHVEQALTNLSTEAAAIREQLESGNQQMRRGLFGWLLGRPAGGSGSGGSGGANDGSGTGIGRSRSRMRAALAGPLASLRWLVRAAWRQLCIDAVLLGGLLIVMRLRGDRRMEMVLRGWWARVRRRLAPIGFYLAVLGGQVMYPG